MVNPFPFPPFTLDMLMRPIKQVQGGAVFVCGAAETMPLGHVEWVIHYNQMLSNTSATWAEVSRLVEETQIFPYCGAFGVVGADPETGIAGKPTFIMAGYRFHRLVNFDLLFQQIIMTSIDGVNWQETHRESAGFCYAAGFDETAKTFYVQCIADMTATGGAIAVLSSDDGLSWASAASIPQSGGFPVYGHPLLTATGTPLVQDGEGNNVPNGGYYGWDKASGTIIKPEILSPYSQNPAVAEVNDVIEIIKVDPATGAATSTTTKTLPIDKVTCVAFAGGIWQAGGFMGEDWQNSGGLQIATSTDDGDTWHVDYTVGGFAAAFCLMGAPPGMIDAAPPP